MNYFLPLAVMACLTTLPALAQGTRADYERANNLRQRVGGKVFRASVKPNWIEGTDRFWYRNDLPEGKREFLLVDPAGPSKKPAFDHARMAEALAKTLGKPVEAEKLPVERIAFVPGKSALLLQVQDKTYSCDLTTYTLQPEKTPLGQANPLYPAAPPFTSRDGGEETTLTFINRTEGEVALFWIDTEGQRHPYGTLPPGESRDMHTYAQHLWLVV